jgi:hypothetical protein
LLTSGSPGALRAAASPLRSSFFFAIVIPSFGVLVVVIARSRSRYR